MPIEGDLRPTKGRSVHVTGMHGKEGDLRPTKGAICSHVTGNKMFLKTDHGK